MRALLNTALAIGLLAPTFVTADTTSTATPVVAVACDQSRMMPKDPHLVFMMEVLSANGFMPQMAAGINLRILGYSLQNLAKLSDMVKTISDDDVELAAKRMDAFHLGMGIGALSYLRIDKKLTVGMEQKRVRPEDDVIKALASQIRGMEPEAAFAYVALQWDRHSIDSEGTVIDRVSAKRLRGQLVSANFSVVASTIETLRLFATEGELQLPLFAFKRGELRLQTQLDQPLAQLEEYLASHPERVAQMQKFGQALAKVFTDRRVKDIAVAYREDKRQNGIHHSLSTMNAYTVQPQLEPIVIEYLQAAFPDLTPEKIKAWLRSGSLFIAE